jgi:hypothetical protein
MGNKLTHETIVVLEGDHALVLVARRGLLEFDLLSNQSLDPESYGAGKYGKRGNRNLAAALSTASRIGPREEGQDASRIPLLVAEVKVVRCGVVEVDGAFDEPQSENSGVEVEIPLRVTRNSGNVMDASGAEAH